MGADHRHEHGVADFPQSTSPPQPGRVGWGCSQWRRLAVERPKRQRGVGMKTAADRGKKAVIAAGRQ